MGSFEEILARDGRLIYKTRGVSMLPMLHQDRDLVVMYAAYLWRSRSTGEDMPRMLRYALNNRLFSRKARGEG